MDPHTAAFGGARLRPTSCVAAAADWRLIFSPETIALITVSPEESMEMAFIATVAPTSRKSLVKATCSVLASKRCTMKDKATS